MAETLARPVRRRPRAAYALPTLFTAGNILLGFLSILESFRGAQKTLQGQTGPDWAFEKAALMIGAAFVLDGLDGRIARLTDTVSDFGREMDSLADVITFGIAPAVLAVGWGFVAALLPIEGLFHEHILRAGMFCSFLYLMCGASRLARFNVTTNPVPKNPGRPDRKYFVGLPIPAAAGFVAAVVYAAEGRPLQWWITAPSAADPTPGSLLPVVWMGVLAFLGFLMVSTWRYRSFKDLNLLRPRTPLTTVVMGAVLFLLWYYSHAMLMVMALWYVGSGIVIRMAGLSRRRARIATPELRAVRDGAE